MRRFLGLIILCFTCFISGYSVGFYRHQNPLGGGLRGALETFFSNVTHKSSAQDFDKKKRESEEARRLEQEEARRLEQEDAQWFQEKLEEFKAKGEDQKEAQPLTRQEQAAADVEIQNLKAWAKKKIQDEDCTTVDALIARTGLSLQEAHALLEENISSRSFFSNSKKEVAQLELLDKERVALKQIFEGIRDAATVSERSELSLSRVKEMLSLFPEGYLPPRTPQKPPTSAVEWLLREFGLMSSWEKERLARAIKCMLSGDRLLTSIGHFSKPEDWQKKKLEFLIPDPRDRVSYTPQAPVKATEG